MSFGDVPPPVPSICSVCQSPIRPGEPSRDCGHCGARYHEECWEHNDGCATYGCAGGPEPVALARVEAPHRGGWGDVKTCPACGRDIDSAALKCKSCGARFLTRAPMTPREYEGQLRRQAAGRKAAWQSLALFAVSALGILAPLTLVYGVVWKRRRRRQGESAEGMGEVLVSMSGILSLAYVALMVVIFGFGW